MVLSIISIVLSSLLSLIAIIISVIAIKKQTRSQDVNANIQLFDKRFEIYKYVYDMWFIVGYFEGGLDKAKSKHTYAEIMSLLKYIDLTEEIQDKINKAYSDSQKFEYMYELLFSGKSKEYLEKTLPLFTIYINGIYHKKCVDVQSGNQAYNKLFKIFKEENYGMFDLHQYLDLSDVKRLDN